MTPSTSTVLRDARRIVVKVGSSLVTNEGRGLDEQAIGEWCRQLSALVRDGREVIMVSSGAIAEGMKRLGWTQRPKELHELQAAAAVGQMGLAQMYETKLRENGLGSAQVLLTHADLADRERYLNARSTLLTLLAHGVLPVINENDTVVNDEIKFGDNDTLGALVANLVEADALIILTDQKGLYTADPRRDPAATFVHEARAGDAKLEEMAGGAGSSIGKGGMITKILAAKRAAGSGASTIIAWGRAPDALLRLAQGENIHTANYISLPTAPAEYDMVEAIKVRAAAHSFEGKVFTVVACSAITPEIVDAIAHDDESRAMLERKHSAFSGIFGPDGRLISEPLIDVDRDAQRGGEVVPAHEGIGMLRAEHALPHGEHLRDAVHRLC